MVRGSVFDDIRFSLRQLARHRAYTLASLATIALGAGAVTAMYTVVDGVLLRPLPLLEADRLVAICETHESVARFCVASPPNARDWASAARTLIGIGVARDWSFKVQADGGPPIRAASGITTASLFRVLGAVAERGRLPTEEEEAAGRRVVVVGHELWRRAFGADSSLIGRTIQLDGTPFEVTGILPRGFRVPDLEHVQLWAPLAAGLREAPGRDWRGFLALARLAPGATIEAAAAELGAIQHALGEQYPESDRGWGIRVESVLERVVGGVRTTLLVFLSAAAVLLLVACANVANLLLARSAQRGREFAVRAAIGAGGSRLFRLVAVEASVLAVIGGVLGLALAVWATDAFLALVPDGLPRADEVRVDARVLLAVLAVVAATSIIAGLGPALRARGTNLAASIRQGKLAGSDGRMFGLRGGFVAAEVALAFVLAAGAGLLTRSYLRYARWDPGFDRHDLATFWVLGSPGTYPQRTQVVALFDRMRAELRSVPGVKQVGMASSGPLFGGVETGEFELDAERRPFTARWYDVWPEFHPTLGIALRQGRWFTDGDREGAPAVALVNETFARQAWQGRAAVGQRLRRKGDAAALEVVGVVADVPPLTPGQRAEPEVYWPYHQAPRWASFVVLRIAGRPETVAPVVLERLRAIDPDLEPATVMTLDERFEARLRRPRFSMLLIGAFAVTAVLLGMVGVAGVTAASVAQRTREFGVRVALGARGSDVVRLVMRQAFTLAAAGLLTGAGIALVLTRLARAVIPGVRPADPLTFGVTALLLGGIAAYASFAPARQAGRIDPMEALRAE